MKRAQNILGFVLASLMLCAGCAATDSARARTVTAAPGTIPSNTRAETNPKITAATAHATAAPTKTLSPTPSAAATSTPAPTHTNTRRPTRRPQPTATFTPLLPLVPAFSPPFPDEWFHTVRFVPADVAPGQTYWRLVSAVFCDVPPPGQKEKTCPDSPGDILDHTVYIAVLDEKGACVENPPILHEINTGERIPLTSKFQMVPWTGCATDYEWSMYGESSDFWLDGLPSDRIGGLLLNSPQLNWAENRAHVRYFVIFQRTVR